MFKRLLAALLLLLPLPALAKGPALWMVKDKDTTVYLFGTIHMLPKDVAWLDGRTAEALAKADTLATEIVAPEAKLAAQTMMARGLSDKLPPLAKRVPPEKAAALNAAVAASGLPHELLDKMDSWFAAITLTQTQLAQLDFARSNGVEAQLAARARGKTHIGLETLDQQLGLFDALPESDQRALLTATVDELPALKGEAARLVKLWADGEVDKLAAELNADLKGSPTLTRALLTDRNSRWAEWIATRMRDVPGTVFVAVGAGHLAGPDSVQAMLTKRGLKAVRMDR